MNGYQFTADSYKTVLEKSENNYTPEQIKSIKQNIRVFETLATFEDGDKYIAFDSGMFNDIFKGYLELLIQEISESSDDKKVAALEVLKKDITQLGYSLLDLYNAEVAEDTYYGRV